MDLRSDPRSRRWVLWGLLSVVFVLVNVHRLSSAVLAEDLMGAFETTGGQLGTLHATFFWVYALMQIPTGILADRVGPRRTATAGGVLMSLGAIWFSVADSYLAALFARGLVGLGGSVIFVCILRFSANWYRADEFATMSGLTFAVAGIGGVMATTPLSIAVDATDWRTTIGWLGLVGVVASVAVYAFVRDDPEAAGLSPIADVPTQPTLSAGQLRDALSTVLADRVTWVVSALLFCATGINLTLFGLWGVPYVAQTYDVSTTYASVFALLGAAGLIVGPPAFGRLSDLLGRRTELMVYGGAVYTTCLAAIAVAGTPPLWLVAVVFFVTGGLLGAFVLSYPVVKERHPDRASGISTGTVNGAAFLGAGTFPTLMGWALDAYWTGEFVGGARVYTSTGYRVAFAIAAAAGFVTFLCTIWVHRRVGG
ncbi:MFS transporter [Halovivax gelatinilyticus]|uniref:MFS transporter n=1 Tax=Halovivax gelatinilyticus TaxID=2961597 RepID=UPI0020CA5B1F|nr:MFS transporter [Halovivax gelatinilyticus]